MCCNVLSLRKCDVGGLVSFTFVIAREMSFFKRKTIFSYKYIEYMWCISYIYLVLDMYACLTYFLYIKSLFSYMYVPDCVVSLFLGVPILPVLSIQVMILIVGGPFRIVLFQSWEDCCPILLMFQR